MLPVTTNKSKSTKTEDDLEKRKNNLDGIYLVHFGKVKSIFNIEKLIKRSIDYYSLIISVVIQVDFERSKSNLSFVLLLSRKQIQLEFDYLMPRKSVINIDILNKYNAHCLPN